METMKKKRGGPRPGSGRPFKADKSQWGQITCVLKRATIAQLRAGAGSKHFGDFLQWHLDRYPLPSRAIYLALQSNEPITLQIKRRKTPVIISAGGPAPAHLRREHLQRPLSKAEFEKAIVAVGR